jgi:hypothetical protein
MPEQHAGYAIADVLTLHASDPSAQPQHIPQTGGSLVAEAPPRVRRRQTIDPLSFAARRRSLAIRPTYETTYRGMPAFWRNVLEGRPPQPA